MQGEASHQLSDKFTALLFGIAVGDALGLPAEGMSREKIRRRWHGEWKMRLLFGRGMISDDTEHALLAAKCLIKHPHDASAFQQALACELRWWFLSAPPAIGLATARACLKLLCGRPLNQTGVHSAGNGPLTRAMVIGAFFANDAKKRREFTRLSTRLTHTDERAEIAAIAIAEVAAVAMRGEPPKQAMQLWAPVSTNDEWNTIFAKIVKASANGSSTDHFVKQLGLERGVTGYAFHTAPVAIYAWIHGSRDFINTLTSVLNCGGDTDSTGAIVGGLLGISCGKKDIPPHWLKRICDWPNSISHVKTVAHSLSANLLTNRGPHWLFFFPQLTRNLFFFIIAVAHGLLRLVW